MEQEEIASPPATNAPSEDYQQSKVKAVSQKEIH
jgi:hypothetical protein